MDSHLIIKIIHMSFASLAFLVFVVRAVMLFRTGVAPAQQAGKSRIVLTALQHMSYSVLVVAGVVLLVNNQFDVQAWFYAKIILFLVLLSASHKAFGRRDLSIQQRKAGVVVALVAFLSVFSLIAWKPDFSAAQQHSLSHHATSDQVIAQRFTAGLVHYPLCKKIV